MAPLSCLAPAGATISLAELGPLGRQLGDGAEGAVFELPGTHGLVFKRYHGRVTASPEHLRALGTFPQGLLPAERDLLLASAAWPRNPVVDGRRCVGFVMPRVPDRFYATLAGGRRIEQQFQHIVYPSERLAKVGLVPPTDGQRARLCLALAELLELLHRHGLVCGDISYKNGLWSLQGGSPAVYLLDCDSLRRRGSPGGGRGLQSAFWDDGADATGATSADSDCYKLGLFVYRALTGQPFARPSRAACRAGSAGLPAGLAQLAAKVEEAPAGQRPTASQWCDQLRRATSGTAGAYASAQGRARGVTANQPGPVGAGRARPTIDLAPASKSRGSQGSPRPRPALDLAPRGTTCSQAAQGKRRRARAIAASIAAVLTALVVLLFLWHGFGLAASHGSPARPKVLVALRNVDGDAANLGTRCTR